MGIDLEEEKPEPILQRHAIVLGYGAFAMLLWVAHVVLRWLHVREIERLEYPQFSADGEEITSVVTLAGFYALIVSAMLARRLCVLLKTGSFKYHFDPKDALIWNIWFVALTVFVVFGYALDAVIPADAPRVLVWPVLTLAVGWISYRVYKRMAHSI